LVSMNLWKKKGFYYLLVHFYGWIDSKLLGY
jgi:hypothetical protein